MMHIFPMLTAQVLGGLWLVFAAAQVNFWMPATARVLQRLGAAQFALPVLVVR